MTIERLKFIFSDASKEKIKTLVSIVISLGYMILMGLRSNLTLYNGSKFLSDFIQINTTIFTDNS